MCLQKSDFSPAVSIVLVASAWLQSIPFTATPLFLSSNLDIFVLLLTSSVLEPRYLHFMSSLCVCHLHNEEKSAFCSVSRYMSQPGKEAAVVVASYGMCLVIRSLTEL